MTSWQHQNRLDCALEGQRRASAECADARLATSERKERKIERKKEGREEEVSVCVKQKPRDEGGWRDVGPGVGAVL